MMKMMLSTTTPRSAVGINKQHHHLRPTSQAQTIMKERFHSMHIPSYEEKSLPKFYHSSLEDPIPAVVTVEIRMDQEYDDDWRNDDRSLFSFDEDDDWSFQTVPEDAFLSSLLTVGVVISESQNEAQFGI